MFIVGHNLVWHSQVPRWVFQDGDGQPLTRDALLARMREHILTVVSHYKGRINGWDVVNEALNDDGTLRQSQWRKIIGDDFIEKAFEYAHEADPNVQLYYNDYSLENEAKRKGAIEIVKRLQAKGIPITGVGVQDHVQMDWPTAATDRRHHQRFRRAGRESHVHRSRRRCAAAGHAQPRRRCSLNIASDPKLNPYPTACPTIPCSKHWPSATPSCSAPTRSTAEP